MNRQQKEQSVSTLQGEFADNQASFLVGYKGLTVAELTQLRRALHPQGGSFKIAKVTLMKRALGEASSAYQELDPMLKNQIGFVFARQEAPAIAKILKNFAKDHDKLVMLGGVLENRLISKSGVEALAALPSREVLLAQLCGTLLAPVSSLARVLNLIAQKQTEEKQAS